MQLKKNPLKHASNVFNFFSAGEDFQSVEFAYKDEAGDKSVFCF